MSQYTQAEDGLIRAHWATMGEKMLPMLPGRTIKSVHTRASLIGISNTARWTKEEDELLTSRYPTMGGRCAQMFANRSREAVRSRAERLGLKVLGRRRPGEKPEKAVPPEPSRDNIPMVISVFHLAAAMKGQV